MWSAIVNVMTKMFDALHSLIVSLGVSENAEGVSYVLAIVLFTAIIRLLILPLNIKATKSNAKMQEIQPEMQKLQKKYANDPQKLQLETSKLMKENNVSMFGGCLPSLLPLPILFALYGVFRNIQATPGADTSFLFIPDIFAYPKGIGFVSIINATTRRWYEYEYYEYSDVRYDGIHGSSISTNINTLLDHWRNNSINSNIFLKLSSSYAKEKS